MYSSSLGSHDTTQVGALGETEAVRAGCQVSVPSTRSGWARRKKKELSGGRVRTRRRDDQIFGFVWDYKHSHHIPLQFGSYKSSARREANQTKVCYSIWTVRYICFT